MHCMREELDLVQRGGSLVNASSIASVRGYRGNAAYSASKAGLVRRSAQKSRLPGIPTDTVTRMHSPELLPKSTVPAPVSSTSE